MGTWTQVARRADTSRSLRAVRTRPSPCAQGSLPRGGALLYVRCSLGRAVPWDHRRHGVAAVVDDGSLPDDGRRTGLLLEPSTTADRLSLLLTNYTHTRPCC
eukprot:scaffold8422_cov82-Phaeocystis_antarctica.AAC.6